MTPILQIKDLTFAYEKEPAAPALENISFNLAQGEFIVILGPSGCGKSTLLRLAAGLLPVQSGVIHLNGEDHSPVIPRMSWMAQNPALLPWLTVRQNISLPLRFAHGRSGVGIEPDTALNLVGLSHFAKAYPFTLSGGMQQRVALARLLVDGSPIWLMDEPFASLDELTREKLASDLLGLWRRFRPAILWVTHNIHEAVRLADRILVLSSRPGRLAANIPVELERPRDDRTAGYLEYLRRARAGLGDRFIFDPESGLADR